VLAAIYWTYTSPFLLNAITVSSLKYLLTSALLILVWTPIISAFSRNGFECTPVHTGRFFLYKKNKLYSTIIRGDSIQAEINAQTGDISKWKIRWTDNCTFTCQYLSRLRFKSDQELNFYNQSKLIFSIKSLMHDYYVFDAELKYKATSRKFTDTLWRQIK
jgi:hypothetical protein